jgi:hypothetical protein
MPPNRDWRPNTVGLNTSNSVSEQTNWGRHSLLVAHCKIKAALLQAMNVQRGRWRWVIKATPRPLYPPGPSNHISECGHYKTVRKRIFWDRGKPKHTNRNWTGGGQGQQHTILIMNLAPVWNKHSARAASWAVRQCASVANTHRSFNIRASTPGVRTFYSISCFINFCKKSKATPLQAWTGPEGSGRLRPPDSQTVGTWRR